MDRRGNQGPMDFTWENPETRVDKSSPFVQFQSTMAQAQSPSKRAATNPFANAAKQPSPLKMAASFSGGLQKSVFDQAALSRQNSAPSGPSFRNPGFTNPSNPAFSTPQSRRFVDFDDSPALTEASEIPETPDVDRSDLLDDFSITSPDQMRRSSYTGKKSGKGELPRFAPNFLHNDKVRKRTRTDRDRDIASTRSRLPGGCDEDDSDCEMSDSDRDNRKRRRSKQNMGWLHYILSTVSANPDAPIVLSYYLQLLVDTCLGGMIVWIAWAAYSSARGEVLYTSERAKLEKLAEIDSCSREFVANKCAPISSRLPALEELCNKWDTCMNQDPNSVAGVKASASHLADIINEFCTRLSYKSMIFILMITVAVVFANNAAFSKFRQNVRHYNHHQPAQPAPSQPAVGFPMSPEKSNQAYIFAPIGHTPRHIRRAFLNDDTDTDASPDARLLPPARTPSRRSPSKDHRSRSPSKR